MAMQEQNVGQNVTHYTIRVNWKNVLYRKLTFKKWQHTMYINITRDHSRETQGFHPLIKLEFECQSPEQIVRG